MITIAPSILSADFAKLADEVKDAERGGADWIHVDIMDGHFVPNLTIGPPVVKSLRPYTKLTLDVHLMVEEPDSLIPSFAAAGADVLTVHAEACRHLNRTLQLIRQNGVKPAVALNPATPPVMLEAVLDDIDMVLVMTVNPGFGGQAFLPGTLAKIRTIRRMLDERGLQQVPIEVDGGIDRETAPLVAEAGATVLVAGQAVFGHQDRAVAIRAIREAAAGR